MTDQEKRQRDKAMRYLNMIRGACRRIKGIEEDLKELRKSRISGVAFDDIHVQTSRIHTLDDVVIQIEKYESSLCEEKTRLLAAINNIRRSLSRVPDLEQRELLTDRYVRRESWVTIANGFLGGESTMYRLHNAALLAFYEKNREEIEEYCHYSESWQ